MAAWTAVILVEFMISRDMGQANSKVKILNFRRVIYLGVHRVSGRIPWEAALRDKGVEQS